MSGTHGEGGGTVSSVRAGSTSAGLVSSAGLGPSGRLTLSMTAALGAGSVLVLAGFAAGDTLLAAAGGALFGLGLATILTGGLLNSSVAIALAAPLPAIYSSGSTRIALVAPVAAAALLAWLIRCGVERAPISTGRLPLRSLLWLVAAIIVATAFARNHVTSLLEALNLTILAGLLLATTSEISVNPRLTRRLVDLLAAAAGICGLLAILQSLGTIPSSFPRWGTPYFRADLGFGQPNALGLFLAILLPLAALRVVESKGVLRVLWAAAFGAALLGLVGTFSRTSWVAVIAGVFGLAMLGRTGHAVRVLGILLVLGVVIEIGSGGMLSDTATRTIGDWVVEQRAALFVAGVLMLLDHPLTGVGPGGFADQVEGYAAYITELWDYQATPHNAFVQMAAESGIFGLIAFVAFLGACLVVFRHRSLRATTPAERNLRSALFCSLVILTVASLGIWPFAHGTGEVVVLLLGLGLAGGREEQR